MDGICKDVSRAIDLDQPHTLRSGADFFLTDKGNLHTASVVPQPFSPSSSSLFSTGNLAISLPSTEVVINTPVHPNHQPETLSTFSNDPTSCSVHPSEVGDALVAGIRQLVTSASDIEKGAGQNADQPSAVLPTSDPTPGLTRLTHLSLKDSIPLNERKHNEPPPSAARPPLEDIAPPGETGGKRPPGPTTSPLAENRFFSFVILHAKADEDTAVRLLDTIGGLGIVGGTTFCDEFERPGQSPLNGLQDAIDNSAFTVLLLSKHWGSRWDNFQMNAALMNSINKKLKYNTVIPLLPRSDPLPEHKRGLALQSLTQLDERRSNFAHRVQKTFSAKTVEEHRRIWQDEEQVRQFERRREDLEESMRRAQQRQEALDNYEAARRNHQHS